MAAPRCMRPLFVTARRVQTSHPRSCTQTVAHAVRTKSSKALDADRDLSPKDLSGHAEIYGDIQNGRMTLDERLLDMGLDPTEYRKLMKSQEVALERSAKWEPKTREEAQKKWKELQDTPDHLTLLQMYKRAGVEPIKIAKERNIKLPGDDKEPLDPKTQAALEMLRTPINVQAVHLRPLRRTPEFGVPVCDLQLRTYSIRNLLLFADFAVRAAYYMGLCARGPVPLPRITERWTVPRSNFIFKKSQENFERITMRRLVQIQDGHPDVVKAWLAFLQKHQMYGVGMKANIWEYESLDAATRAGYALKDGDYRRRREGPTMIKAEQILRTKGFRDAMAGHQKAQSVELRP